MKRQVIKTGPKPSPASPPAASVPKPRGAKRVTITARSRDEVEAGYVAAREAWTTAMRAASSGRPADLASLAIAQDAYEAAAAERERMLSGARIPIPVEPSRSPRDVEIAIGQELAWRKVLDHDEAKPGFLGRLFHRRTRS